MPEVRVKFKEGPVTIRQPAAQGGTTTWHVRDGTVDVADDKLDLFLSRVEGSSVVSKPDASNKDK